MVGGITVNDQLHRFSLSYFVLARNISLSQPRLSLANYRLSEAVLFIRFLLV